MNKMDENVVGFLSRHKLFSTLLFLATFLVIALRMFEVIEYFGWILTLIVLLVLMYTVTALSTR